MSPLVTRSNQWKGHGYRVAFALALRRPPSVAFLLLLLGLNRFLLLRTRAHPLGWRAYARAGGRRRRRPPQAYDPRESTNSLWYGTFSQPAATLAASPTSRRTSKLHHACAPPRTTPATTAHHAHGNHAQKRLTHRGLQSFAHTCRGLARNTSFAASPHPTPAERPNCTARTRPQRTDHNHHYSSRAHPT